MECHSCKFPFAGEHVYGRVFWSPQQDLRDSYKLSLDQVFICAGI